MTDLKWRFKQPGISQKRTEPFENTLIIAIFFYERQKVIDITLKIETAPFVTFFDVISGTTLLAVNCMTICVSVLSPRLNVIRG